MNRYIVQYKAFDAVVTTKFFKSASDIEKLNADKISLANSLGIIYEPSWGEKLEIIKFDEDCTEIQECL